MPTTMPSWRNSSPSTRQTTALPPPNVYEAVLGWLRDEGTIGTDTPIIRPFWPGGDYTKETYAEGSCVVDNPPFSIMASILRHYTERGIPFFLFAQSLTLFSGSNIDGVTYIVTNSDITYANGANVRTGFITNLPAFSQWAVMTSPSLAKRINEAMDKAKTAAPQLPKYVYPYNVITSAGLQRIAKYTDIRIPRNECTRIRRMDAQIPLKKAIFGTGFLCSDRVAAELKAAELKAAWTFSLSDREREIVDSLALHD